MSSFINSFRAVFWSFLGVRKGRDQEQDFAQLRPLHVIIAAVVSAAIFVGVLIAVVSVVTR